MSDLDKLIEAVESGASDWNIIACLCETAGIALPHSQIAANAYNGSLDAAKALHDALLPDFIVQELSQNSRAMGWNMLIVNEAGNYISSHQGGKTGFCDNPARAWLLAVLRAYRETQP